jgi:ribosomal protein S18 acetylase RimI-like enzyme
MSMHLRTLEQVDLHEAAVLFDNYRQFYRQPSNVRAAQSFIAERLRKRDSLFTLMECDAVLAGFVQVYPTLSSIAAADVWVINDLYVEPRHRGRGVARELMGWVYGVAQTAGIRQVRISTETSNVVAQSLYESIGYTADARFKYYVATIPQADPVGAMGGASAVEAGR